MPEETVLTCKLSGSVAYETPNRPRRASRESFAQTKLIGSIAPPKTDRQEFVRRSPNDACVSRRYTRAAAAAALAASAVGGAAAVLQAVKPQTAGAARTASPPLGLALPLPTWLAPGASITVTGWAGPTEVVQLLANGAPLGRARSGTFGKFTLRLRTPTRSGTYRLVLRAGARRSHLPSLLVRPVVVAAVGDVNLGDRIATAIRSYGGNYPWTSVAPVLRAADIAVANLECAVSTGGTPASKAYTFRGDPAALSAVAKAGVDVVSLANNHSLDFGIDAFRDTIRHLKKAGVTPVGGGGDLSAARAPALVTAGGLRFAILAYSDIRPYGFDATPLRPGAAPADVTALASDVRRARRKADSVIVYFHWGVELARSPDYRQQAFAAAAFNAGATVVLGAHPHVLQPVRRVGRRLVAWSLGNFVFGAQSAGTSNTGILTIGLDRLGVRWSEFVPARIEGVRPIVDRDRANATLRRLAHAKGR